MKKKGLTKREFTCQKNSIKKGTKKKGQIMSTPLI